MVHRNELEASPLAHAAQEPRAGLASGIKPREDSPRPVGSLPWLAPGGGFGV